MKIQILVDNPKSWIVPYAKDLVDELSDLHDCKLIFNHDEVEKGDILCLLSCERIFRFLELNSYNLVVHESDLPHGKGWSPVTWQVLEGKSDIPVTLFEASENVDSGVIYAQDFIKLDGTELLPEIKDEQGRITIKLILDFVSKYPHIKGVKQVGQESFYNRRKPKDSEIDTNLSIEDQFNLLRVCDNERYPAHFTFRNQKYIIKIYKEDDQ